MSPAYTGGAELNIEEYITEDFNAGDFETDELKTDDLNREDIREKTMQLIYQMDMTHDYRVSDLSIIEENITAAGTGQAAAVLAAVQEHHEEIDRIIAENLDRWTLDRIARTDLAILRTAAAEMLYLDDVPVRVSINEAVNLAKKYGDERSYAFVNSVLGKIARQIK